MESVLRLICCLCLLVLLFSSIHILMPITVVKAGAQVIIHNNHSSYVDKYGLLRIVGEVENTGDVSLESIQITANFYDSQDNIAATAYTMAMLNILPPQTRAPFKITLATSSPDLISRIDRYTLNVAFRESNTELIKTLLLLSANNYTDAFGLLHIVGELQNNGTRMSTSTEVMVTCYNKDDTVVDVGSALANPYSIDVGQKANFEIMVADENIVPYEIVGKDRTVNVSRYDIVAVSKEAILVPEFSSTIMFVLVASHSVLLLIMNKRINKLEKGAIRKMILLIGVVLCQFSSLFLKSVSNY